MARHYSAQTRDEMGIIQNLLGMTTFVWHPQIILAGKKNVWPAHVLLQQILENIAVESSIDLRVDQWHLPGRWRWPL